MYSLFKVIIATVFVSLSHLPQALSADVYKYKNNQGKWVFSDKKPTANADTETLSYDSNLAEKIEPRIYFIAENNIEVINPLYIPIEIKFSDRNSELLYQGTVAEKSTEIIYLESGASSRYNYSWVRGNPDGNHTNTYYQTPFKTSFKRKITQAFNGNYSHTSDNSKYAVDIALPVGTPIVAARSGIVIYTKDDYAFSGKSKYFLNKANRVEVLHDDGSYAVYAHLLQGTVSVNIGDSVTVGAELGKSGSSGFSTGPHLHFVIHKNIDFKTVSVPFQFSDNNGNPYTPTAGYYIQPNR
ncbi:MAG: murein DD-endopeptidase MepM/ murein hydrolase activator NlpD [Porticoccus sp.]